MSDTREKLVNLSRRRALVERQGTHWDGCATEGGPRHYECAVARIAAAEGREKALLADAERWQALCNLWMACTIMTLTQDEDGSVNE